MTAPLDVVVFGEGLGDETYARRCLVPFARGVVAAGDRCRLSDDPEYTPCEVAVVFGDVRDAPAKRERMRLKAEVKGRHVHRGLVVVDTPVLLRATAVGDTHRRVGLDGIHADTGTFVAGCGTGRRFDQLAARAGLLPTPPARRGDEVLVLLQRPCDASLRGAERRRPGRYGDWLRQTVTDLLRQTNRPIAVRPHPASLADAGEVEWLRVLARELEGPRVAFDLAARPLASALATAWATVAFNSGGSIDGLLAGVPAVVTDPGSFAWPVAAHDTAAVDALQLPELEPWLHRLAWVDWSLDELASGTLWQHLRELVALAV